MEKKLYQCNACKRLFQREASKKSIKSHCDEMQKDATLIRIDNYDKLIKQYRNSHLKHGVGLSSFDKKTQLFLKMAFDQGAYVMFHNLIH